LSELTPELERKLGQAVERMPAFPRSVQRVLELTRNINCPPKEIVGVIEKDPVMTMKIFKVINSAYYSLPNKITSVGQSVVYLGINTVKNLALGFAAVGILPRTTPPDSTSSATCCIPWWSAARCPPSGAPSSRATRSSLATAYVAGLLHDFGKIVLAQFLPAEFSEAMRYSTEQGIPLHEAENRIIGIDHGVVGAMLAHRWTFPVELVDCIRDHHDPRVGSALLDCLRTADQIVRLRGIGDSGNSWRVDEAPLAPLRFGEDLDAVINRMGALDKIVDEAMVFAQVAHE
jgi:HD-like signal output (HDOD) protein